MKADLNDDEFKQAYLQGKLAIDCLEITLTQNGADKPRIYKLAGSLLVNVDNGVEGRLVWPRDAEHPYDMFASLLALQNVKSGDLFPENHYFSLRAIETGGRVWTHPAVFLKVIEHQKAEILTIQCDYIQMELEVEVSRSLAHFVFHDDLEIRSNRILPRTDLVRGGERHVIKAGASSGTVDGLEVNYYPVGVDKSGGAYEFTAVAPSGKELPVNFDERLLEAIQFCVAKLAWPVMREVIRDGKQTLLLSKSKPFNNGQVSAAVPDHESTDFYRLMEGYYQYANSESVGNEPPWLSKKIGGLFTLKGVWLDTIALLAGVTVEGILKDAEFKKLGAPDDEALSKIDCLIDYVAKAESVDPNLKTRAETMMSGAMKSSSASDRLHVLAKAGVVDEDDIKAWKSMRHPAAHGGLVVDQSKLQELVTNVHRVVTMIYKLAFFRIGYCGAYTNFGVRGWPPAQFDADACRTKLGALVKK